MICGGQVINNTHIRNYIRWPWYAALAGRTPWPAAAATASLQPPPPAGTVATVRRVLLFRFMCRITMGVTCSLVLLFVSLMCRRPAAGLQCCCFAPVDDPLGLLQQPLFVDRSRFVRPMGIIKWGHSPLCYLMFLLFLSGDVQPNPGPDTPGLELCSVCSEAVLDDHKAVCCDLGDSWVYVTCDPSLSDDLYCRMIQEPSNEPWFCTMCYSLAPVSVPENQHLSN